MIYLAADVANGSLNEVFDYLNALDLIRWGIESGERTFSEVLEKVHAPFTSTDFARLLCMEPDGEGIWHASFDCWQQYFGYNDLYDLGFNEGTYMDRLKFIFEYEGKEMVLWAWKGDYINLGLGMELGIYERGKVFGLETEHWVVNKENALPMSAELVWNATDENSEIEMAVFEVDFETEEKFEAFMKNKDYYMQQNDCNIYKVPETYRVTIVW